MNFPKIFLEQIIVIEIMVSNEKSGLKKMKGMSAEEQDHLLIYKKGA